MARDAATVSAPGTRRRNARGEGARLRGEILAAAARMLASAVPGPPLSLRAIAQEAGIAAPSIYRHFASLDALLAALMASLFDELAAERDRAEAEAAERGGDAYARLLARSLAYVRFGLARPGAYRLLYEDAATALFNDPALAACGDAMTARTVALLRDHAAGSPSGDERPRALLLWAGLHGIVSIRLHRPAMVMPPWESQVVAMIEALVARG